MAITPVGFDSQSLTATGGDMTLTMPAGYQAGDLAFIYARADDVGNDPVLTINAASTGWTKILDERPQGGRDRKEDLWWKLLTASETDPIVEISINQERSCSLHVFRGADQTNPLDVTFDDLIHFLSPTADPTTACPPVTTVTDGAAVVLFQGIQQTTPISAAGAPAGFTLAAVEFETHANMVVAYDLDVGAAGTVTPGAWTHTVVDTGADSSLATVAIRPAASGGSDATWTAEAAPGVGGAYGLESGGVSLTLVAQNPIAGTGGAYDATASGASSAVAQAQAAPGAGGANNATVQTSTAQPTGFVSDDFNAISFKPEWTYVDPLADTTLRTAETGTPDARAEIDIPAGGSTSHSSFGADRNAPWLAQAVNDVDITLTTKWLTLPAVRYQIQGLQFAQNNNNWIRFDIYHDGTNIYAFAASSNGSSSDVKVNTVITPTGPAVWLRVARTGDSWQFDWSDDGTNWTTAVTFTHVLTLTGAGPYAGTQTPDGASTEPGFVAQLDYVEDSLDLIAAEDVGPPGGAAAEAAPGLGGANDATVMVSAAAATAPGAGGANDAVPLVAAVPQTAPGYGGARSALDGGRVTDGLLSFWGFDEATGDTVYDLIGRNDLTIEAGGGSTWQPGRLDIATATRLETAGPASGVIDPIQQSGEFTIEGWLNPLLADDTGPAVILGMNEDAGGPGNFTLGQGDDDGNDPGNVWSLRVRRTGSGNNLGNPGTNTTVGTTLTAGQIHHVMFTVETSGSTMTITRYVDGQLDGTTTRTITAGQPFDNWTDETITAANESVNGRPWAGSIYLLALYDRALTPAEADQNYQAGPGEGLTTVTAQAAPGTGGAYDAAVSTSGTVTAQSAAGAGGAYDATASTASNATAPAETAPGSGGALFTPGASISLTLISENPISGIGGAYDATVATTAATDAQAAPGTGGAYDAAISTDTQQTAQPTTAPAAGGAYNATVRTIANAGTAPGAGGASNAVPAVSVIPQTAPGTGAALSATILTTGQNTIIAGTAPGTGGANNATVIAMSNITVHVAHKATIGPARHHARITT